MTAEIPRFIEILSLARLAFRMGEDDYHDRRRTRREFEGALPRRRKRTLFYLEKIRAKTYGAEGAVMRSFSGPEGRLLIAAYDEGIRSTHELLQSESGQ